MGYSCRYELSVFQMDHPTQAFDTASERYDELLTAFLKVKDFRECARNENGPFEVEGLEWESEETRYNPEDELKEISMRFPEMLLALDWVGEDGEAGREYIYNGKTQSVYPEYPPFIPEGDDDDEGSDDKESGEADEKSETADDAIKVKVYHGYMVEGGSMDHAWRAVDPSAPIDTRALMKEMAEEIGEDWEDPCFQFDSEILAIPSSVVERTKAAGVNEYFSG